MNTTFGIRQTDMGLDCQQCRTTLSQSSLVFKTENTRLPVFGYLAICAIGVAYWHEDLGEELLGLLLCVLLLCNTSGCI